MAGKLRTRFVADHASPIVARGLAGAARTEELAEAGGPRSAETPERLGRELAFEDELLNAVAVE